MRRMIRMGGWTVEEPEPPPLTLSPPHATWQAIERAHDGGEHGFCPSGCSVPHPCPTYTTAWDKTHRFRVVRD